MKLRTKLKELKAADPANWISGTPTERKRKKAERDKKNAVTKQQRRVDTDKKNIADWKKKIEDLSAWPASFKPGSEPR